MVISKRVLFFSVLVLHIALWLIMKPVWPFSDDYCYAFHADAFNKHGILFTENAFQNRIGVWFPASIIFRCIGINPYSIALWPLIASLLTLAIAYQFGKRISDETTAILGAFLISINVLQITYSVALFPDIFIALYSAAAICFLYLGRTDPEKKIFPVLFSLSLILGFLTKETILLIFPFIVLVLLSDLKKRDYRFWKKTAIVFFGGSAFLLLIYWIATGDPFYRIHVILNTELLDNRSTDFMVNHYSHNPILWLRKQYGIVFILLLSISVLTTIRKYDLKEARVFLLAFVFSVIFTIIAALCFYKYGVLFLMDRVWMLLIAPMSLLSAMFIRNMHQHFCIVLIVLLCILAFYSDDELGLQRTMLYLAFLALVLLGYYLSRKNKSWSYLMLFPFVFLAGYFIFKNNNYKTVSVQSGDLIKEQIEKLNNGEKRIILTGEALSENHIIYNSFNEYPEMHFYPFSKHDSLSTERMFCIVNGEEENTPGFVEKEKWKKIFSSGALSVYRNDR